jgi:hypothetical protein
VNIIEAVKHPTLFASWFTGNSWRAWLTFLKALFGLDLDEDDTITYAQHTKRTAAPQGPFREAWLVVGRRGGKSLIASLVAVFLAAFKDYSAYLKPGEVGTIAVIAADRRQARTILRYVDGFLRLPVLNTKIRNATQESIELDNRVVIEVHTASFRSVRGYTLLAVIADEIAFWRSEESANPDTEIIASVRPGLATIPNSLLLCISSPYARRGALWQAYTRHFGKDSPAVLVWQASTRAMNPVIDETVIQQALDEDESSARAEYFAEFRRDLEPYVSREVVEGAIVLGRHELGAIPGVRYIGFVDPSGGSKDSFTLGLAHEEFVSGTTKKKIVLDLIREVKPPFSPDAVVSDFAKTLREYRITTVRGDRYAGEWPRERFQVHGIFYQPCDLAKSDLYQDLLPLLNSGRIELLDIPRLKAQLSGLERRTSRAGRDSIDHAPGSHDDVINAAAGALVYAGGSKRGGQAQMVKLVEGGSARSDDDDLMEKVRRYYEKPDPFMASALFTSDHPERLRWQTRKTVN